MIKFQRYVKLALYLCIFGNNTALTPQEIEDHVNFINSIKPHTETNDPEALVTKESLEHFIKVFKDSSLHPKFAEIISKSPTQKVPKELEQPVNSYVDFFDKLCFFEAFLEIQRKPIVTKEEIEEIQTKQNTIKVEYPKQTKLFNYGETILTRFKPDQSQEELIQLTHSCAYYQTITDNLWIRHQIETNLDNIIKKNRISPTMKKVLILTIAGATLGAVIYYLWTTQSILTSPFEIKQNVTTKIVTTNSKNSSDATFNKEDSDVESLLKNNE